MVRNGQWGETDHPFFLEKLWMKFVNDITCTGTVLPVVACHTSSIPVQDIGEGRPKWAPEVKWATPCTTANLVNGMEKIMMLVSNPSREGTMECVACELQHKIK